MCLFRESDVEVKASIRKRRPPVNERSLLSCAQKAHTVFSEPEVPCSAVSQPRPGSSSNERASLVLVIAAIILAREHVAPCHSPLNPLVTRLNGSTRHWFAHSHEPKRLSLSLSLSLSLTLSLSLSVSLSLFIDIYKSWSVNTERVTGGVERAWGPSSILR